MKKTVIRSLIVILAVIAAFALLFTAGSLFGSPRIKGHLYLGDHITLHMNVEVDGRDISLDNARVSCIHESRKEEVAARAGTYRIRGGDYGLYDLALIIPAGAIEGEEKDITVRMEYYNANNWYIIDAGCNLRLTKTEGGYEGTASVDCRYNDGRGDRFADDITVGSFREITVEWGFDRRRARGR